MIISAAAGESPSYQRILVVDAANVIGHKPDGWWKDRAAAVRRLLVPLVRYAAARPHQAVVVVVEGKAKPVATEASTTNAYDPVEIIAARGSGDDRILEFIEKHGTDSSDSSAPPIALVTADRELCRLARSLGASITSPRRLWSDLDAEP